MVKLADIFGPTGRGALGLDVGVENLATDSNGVAYGKLSPDRSANRKPIEHSLARQKRGSRRWRQTQKRLARQRCREAHARRTRHFQIASKIVSDGPQIIVVEKLCLKNMTCSARGTTEKPGTNVKAKSGLNRSVLDAGLAQFIQILTDKAESAGRLVVTVDPKGTSQRCSDCGEKVAKTLKQRWHTCSCGAEYHRDHNAARNVLQRGVVAPLRQAA